MIDPASPQARAQQLYDAGRFVEAGDLAEESLRLDPSSLEALDLVTLAWIMADRPERAIEPARRALDADPDRHIARRRLAAALGFAGRRIESLAEVDRLLAAGVDDPTLRLMRADTLRDLLRHGESLREFRESAARYPDDGPLAVGIPHVTNYIPGLDPAEMLEEHRRYGRFVARTASPRPAWRVTPEPERPLRVGLLSADLRLHSVAYFVEPLLEHADRARMSLICFSTGEGADWMTDRLKRHAAGWHALGGRAAPTVAHRVLTERIDVLIDLGGLMTNPVAIQTMHLRPAPVRVTYLGYPNTTGVEAIQYRFVDSLTDPSGSESRAVETLIRLDPCFLCYRPSEKAPEVDGASPASRDLPTFGSFNNVHKINDEVIALWARTVAGVPGARLLLKEPGPAFNDPLFCDQITARFEKAGLARDRVEMIRNTPEVRDHLALYSRVDVALDPFPYNGTTTTVEAMWMGVPVVTLRGTAHAGLVGTSLLSAVGLPDLIAGTPEDFVNTAASLGRDRARRSELRRTLRARVAGSTLCDGPAFARRFEDAVRTLWKAWCAERKGAATKP